MNELEYDCIEEMERMDKHDLFMESGGDDGQLFPDDPDVCPECGGVMRLVWDNNYGSDADGRRGIRVEWLECRTCGYCPPSE